MKGLFDCLRNRIYREDEDILKQIAANAAVDDSEIEAFEADDEDEEDEWDLGGIDVDEIDDADIERVTNEFNMDEGNRAACRLRTIDLKEDNVELQPETKLNKKVSQDPDMRDFVGAGDGSGHDMKTEDTIYNERLTSKSTASKDYMAKELVGDVISKDYVGKNAKNVANKPFKAAIPASKPAPKPAATPKAPAPVVNSQPQGPVKPINKSVPAAKKGVNWKKGAAIAGGVAAAGAAAYGGKKLYDHIKAKRAAKAKEVAMEEGVSLEEAYAFILECEENLLNEGFALEDIYEEDVYEEDNVELQPETKLNKKVSQDPDMRDFVGAGDGSGHDMKTESFDLIMEEVMNEIAILDEEAEERKYTKDYAKKGAAIGAGAGLAVAGKNIIKGRKQLADAIRQVPGGKKAKIAGATIGLGTGAGLMAAKGALYGAAAGAGAGKGRELGEKIKAKRAAKAREVAVEEAVSLEEAYEFIFECEQDLLDEGYELEEIYEEDVYDEDTVRSIGFGNKKRLIKSSQLKKGAAIGALGAAGMGAAAYGAKKFMDNRKIKHAYDEDVYEEDSVELQPETKLNRRISQDPDMRDFVGAGDGSGHDMKTEAAILAYEEGISLEEAMEWLMEDEVYDEGLIKNVRAQKAAKRDYKDAKRTASRAADEELDPLYKEYEDKRKAHQRAGQDLDDEYERKEDDAYNRYYKAKRDAKDAYRARKREIWHGKKEDVVDDAIAKLGRDGNDNGVFPTRVDLQDEVYDEGGDPDECAPKRQHQRPVGNVDAVSVDGIDTDDELMLGVEAVIREIEESLDLDDFDC